MKKNKSSDLFRHLASASQIGINLVVSTLVGVFIGKGLDYLFKTSPYLTIVFFFFGVAAGFIELFRMVKKILDKDE